MDGSGSSRVGQGLLVFGVVAVLVLVGGRLGTTAGAMTMAVGSMVLLVIVGTLLIKGRRGRPGEEDASSEEGGGDRDTQFLTRLVIFACIVRLVLAFVLHGVHFGALTFAEYLAPDEQTFDNNGWQFAQWLGRESRLRLSWKYLETLQVGYFYVVGFCYFLFGHHVLIPIALNCVIGALCAVPAHRIGVALRDRYSGRVAAVLVSFLPSLVIWSSLLIRDVFVVFFILWIFVVVMRLKRRFSLGGVVVLLFLLAAVGTFRQYIFLVLCPSIAISFLLTSSQHFARSLTIGALAVIGMVLLIKHVGFGAVELKQASLESLAQQRRWNALEAGAGSFHSDIDISTPTNALVYLPIGMAWFLFAPFPWQITGLSQILALPDVLIWYALVPSTLIGMFWSFRNRFSDVSVIIVTTAALVVLYSLVEGNVGIIFRHRAQVLAPFMCFAGVGLSLRRERKAARIEAEKTLTPASRFARSFPG